jgi:hypothetical protein
MKCKNPWASALLVVTGALPLALLAQMPPQSAKLVISSEPAGAEVTINNDKMKQATNATFVVSPGTYTVTVTGSDRALACTFKFTVASGDTRKGTCTKTGSQQ